MYLSHQNYDMKYDIVMIQGCILFPYTTLYPLPYPFFNKVFQIFNTPALFQGTLYILIMI